MKNAASIVKIEASSSKNKNGIVFWKASQYENKRQFNSPSVGGKSTLMKGS